MSALAQKHGAINLSQGFPDFDAPPELLARVSYHLNHGHNQYAPLAGIPELRQAIADKVESLYLAPDVPQHRGNISDTRVSAARVDPEHEIAVTPGATEAIYAAVTALIHPGDEAILFDPAYDTYDPSVRLNGGIAHHVPMYYPEFGIDWQRVGDTINDRTRLILINSPHNPTGSVWQQSDIDALTQLTRDRNITLISDEVYEHICFDGHNHLSLLSYPELREKSFVISSFGKTNHTTGWRIGYCIAPPHLMREFLKIHQFINFSTNTPMQYAIADFLRSTPQHYLGLSEFYQRKRDLFCGLLKPSRFSFVPSAGTYFQLLDYSNLTEASPTQEVAGRTESGNRGDLELARRLTIEHKVASIPVSVFYQQPPQQKILRFCFAKDDATLEQAARILCSL